MQSGESRYQLLLQEIEQHGWVALNAFIDSQMVSALCNEIKQKDAEDELNRAAIGRELGEHINDRVRGDYISWFDEENASQVQRSYMHEMEQLMEALNRYFFLGLFEYEIMYAAYPRGNFYARHIDQHKDVDARVITVITYLNDDWDETKGGQLRIYLKDGSSRDIVPVGGTMVCFLSAEFEHEVLPATDTRYSVTGWLRRRIV